MAQPRINADKPHLWKADIASSVDQFNRWFLDFAPEAYRSTRIDTTERVRRALLATEDFRVLTPKMLRDHPAVITTLRMATAPPIARDRLIGLAKTLPGIVLSMEEGRLPLRMEPELLDSHLERMCAIVAQLLDRDIFPWLDGGVIPTDVERNRAATIVADRLCGAVSNPIVRNAQERRQLVLVENLLLGLGYRRQSHPSGRSITEMEPGTFTFRLNLPVGESLRVNIPIDIVIQPKQPRSDGMPVLIEAKSAGDFTNTNKRRKEEATKIHQFKKAYGEDVTFILFLCGYFGSDYLGYEAAEGIDWVWEHRIEDLLELGL